MNSVLIFIESKSVLLEDVPLSTQVRVINEQNEVG